MENASKALIIAGAILISILLIAISMYIYNSAQGTINNAASKMSEQEKSVYNSSVSSYIGTNKKGVDVKSLIDAVIASNNNCAGDSGKFIAIKPVNFTGIGGVTATGVGADKKAVEGAADDAEIKEIANGTFIGDEGDSDNNDKVVNEAANAMSQLKTYVNMGKRYNIVADYSSGLVIGITITEVQ